MHKSNTITDMPCCVLLHCISLIVHFVFFFFTSWRSVATLQPESLLAPFSNSICSLCVSVPHFDNYSDFKIFHCYYICYCDLLSVILDITILTVWGTTNSKNPRKTVSLLTNIVCILTAPPISPSPTALPLFGLPCSLRHNNTKIRPINTRVSKEDSLVSHFKKKKRND